MDEALAKSFLFQPMREQDPRFLTNHRQGNENSVHGKRMRPCIHRRSSYDDIWDKGLVEACFGLVARDEPSCISIQKPLLLVKELVFQEPIIHEQLA